MSKIHLKREPNYKPKYEAYTYQTNAVKAIRDLEYAAIFHEQGLGKTKIAIDLILYWFEKKLVDTVLFIVKKSLLTNWLRELKKASYIKPRVLSQDRRKNYYVFNSPARVMIANYEVIKSELARIKLFLKTRDVGAILDESTKIKNPKSMLTKSFFEVGPLFKRRIIMTGTPSDNRPYDIWSQIHFLDQGKSLGCNFDKFRRNVNLTTHLYKDKKAQINLARTLESIYPKISSFSVRETKKSGIIKLPKKTITSIKTEWEKHQYELYEQVREEERAIVLKNGVPVEDKSEEILKRLLRLVQIASNPYLIDSSYSKRPGKFPFLYDLVTKILNKNEKCIIWSSFVKNVDWLAREFEEFGTCKVHSKLPMQKRDSSIEEFVDETETKILVATPGAAREGLTLTVANNVIFYDRGFGLSDYIQAQARIHRISQQKECYVYNLIMDKSIDEWTDLLLESKELAAQLAQGDISLKYYNARMSYDFGRIIREILRL